MTYQYPATGEPVAIYRWDSCFSAEYTPPEGWVVAGWVRCSFHGLPSCPKFSVLLKRVEVISPESEELPQDGLLPLEVA